jgi:transcriptional regulator with XRE-family HTH domain
MSTLQERLFEVINLLGWKDSQADFAMSLGIKRTTIIGYIKGTSPPSAEFLTNLNEKYGISVDWILTGKGEKLLVNRATNPIVRETEAISEYKEAFEKHFQELGKHLKLAEQIYNLLEQCGFSKKEEEAGHH